MAGLLVHANVVNMLLKDRFIDPVPVWVDWMLVFLLAYISIALYRILRTKPPGRFGVAVLITTMLFSEAVIVFFLPLIAFFYFDTKISYNLMATAALLFIPANALTTWLRFRLRERQMQKEFCRSANPLSRVICRAFKDNEPFIAHTRLLHAGLALPSFAYAVRMAETKTTAPWSTADLHPTAEDWARVIPEIREVLEKGEKSAEFHYFLLYLGGKKEERMRESAVKEAFLSTELQTFNEFVVFDEWELILPRVTGLWTEQLRAYLDIGLFSVTETREVIPLPGAPAISEEKAGKFRELSPGLYRIDGNTTESPARLSPYCVYAECKLHRKPELFVLGGMMRKQHGFSPIPSFFGEEPNCEPVLSPSYVTEILESSASKSHRERIPT
jgi:hypothetical protein